MDNTRLAKHGLLKNFQSKTKILDYVHRYMVRYSNMNIFVKRSRTTSTRSNDDLSIVRKYPSALRCGLFLV